MHSESSTVETFFADKGFPPVCRHVHKQDNAFYLQILLTIVSSVFGKPPACAACSSPRMEPQDAEARPIA